MSLGGAVEKAISLENRSVSSSHAKTTISARGTVAIRGLKAGWGVRISGFNWNQAKLQAGDRIQFGILDFQLPGSARTVAAWPQRARLTFVGFGRQ